MTAVTRQRDPMNRNWLWDEQLTANYSHLISPW